MKKSLRFAARIGMVAFLFWLPAMQQAEAQRPPTCEAANNTSCSPLGATQPCRSLFSGQTLTCYCFNHNGNLIWSCPVPAGPQSAGIDSCANQAVNLTALIGPGPAPYCGDRCETEGDGRGCREVTPGGTFRTPCRCTNGVWTC
jgi:hypothetical protein